MMNQTNMLRLGTYLATATLALMGQVESASAAGLTRARAEKAMKREVRDRYPDMSQQGVEAKCRRLTTVRFKCRYVAHASSFEEGYYGYCGYQGVGYVRRYPSGALDATASRPRERPQSSGGRCYPL